MANPTDSVRDLYVLGTLSRGKTHGHDLMKTIRLSRADRWVSLSEKHVYYVLAKLARLGWISETRDPDPSPVPRKIYDLTVAGRTALVGLLRSQALRESFAPMPFDAVFGMLAYTDVLSRDEVLGILRARREVLASRLAEDALPPAGLAAMEQSFGYLALSLYGKTQILLKTELAWLDGVIRKVARSDLRTLRVPDAYLDATPMPAPPPRRRKERQ
jgi:DNA-binding PadR family transcriptional regulator